jgi:hypothetical protein
MVATPSTRNAKQDFPGNKAVVTRKTKLFLTIAIQDKLEYLESVES